MYEQDCRIIKALTTIMSLQQCSTEAGIYRELPPLILLAANQLN